MVRVGTVAVDSTKLAANASAARNLTLEGLEAEAARIIEDAIATDRREDELYGEQRGDELPAELADPATRKARIKELLEHARAERAAADDERDRQLVEHQEHFERTGKRKRGRQPQPEIKRPRQQKLLSKKYNLTDPDSGLVRSRTGFIQGYSMQTVVSEDQIILTARAMGTNPDQGQLAPAVEAAVSNMRSFNPLMWSPRCWPTAVTGAASRFASSPPVATGCWSRRTCVQKSRAAARLTLHGCVNNSTPTTANAATSGDNG